MPHALAALALCLSAAAADYDAGSAPLTRAESARLAAEHERAGQRLMAALDAVTAQRQGYGAAADPDAHLKRWGALLIAAEPLFEALLDIGEQHRKRHNALEFARIARAVRRVTTETRADIRLSDDLHAVQETNLAMAARQEKQFNRYWGEGGLFREAMEARAAARERQRRDRDLWLQLAAGGAAALLLAVWAARRYARSPPEQPVLAAPAGEPAPPAQVVPALVGGNIDVVRPLGRGGMGEVYEGLDRTLQRRVALKRLRPELTGSPADLSRLLKEARLVAALKHPNVVAIHSVEKEAGQVFLVFEYVDGPTLAAVIAQKRRLPWPEALRVFAAAAAALDAAHRQNIVHRDLKPANIMLDSKGVVKVMDFGIAYEAAVAVSRLTRSGAWGTPPYMSPEQELGEVNTGADLFALNVVLYEMLTGELPFTGPNFLAQKREGVYVPASQAAPDAPQALDAFFATAFSPDPVKRVHDAAALAAAAKALI